MASFQKPENALKRAEELIEVGKKQDALDTLHAWIQGRKFKAMWTTTNEQIMIRHLELCVELKKMRVAREALHQYRTTCQANISSLETVVKRFREAAEEKVNEAKKQKDLQMAEMENLDEMEAPQTILLRAIQAQDTRQQSQDRDVHMHFRFLWDTYKVVLDVLKSNVRLEEVYHETARHAFEFCRANTRPAEFKRLCETLRKNYQDLFKRTGPVPAHQVNPNSPDTFARTLETRCNQLKIATELDLWREAYFTANEIYELMNKTRPKPHLRSMYYEYLGQIFWKSDNYLFHAFSCLKNVLFVKAAKQNLHPDELQLLASKAVLATLCVPFQRNSDIHATLELTTEGASSPYEKAKKHAALFNAQSVPTRESIGAQIQEKGLLALAAEPCKKLFALIESDFTPLTLCQDAKPFLDEINGDVEGTSVCNGKLAHYITPLKQIIFFRLMKQLSEVYANMTIANFERAASIVPFSIAEKWMANAARQQGINIQINYSHKAIVFGAPRKVDMKSMRQPLIEIGYKLQQAMARVAPEEQHKKERLEKVQLSENIVPRIEEETKLIRQRKEEIERRKEESERRKEAQEREAMEKLKKQEAREAEAERLRQEDERERRAREREEQKKKEAAMAKNKEMLEQMKKQAEQNAKNVKVAGKKITEIVVDDLEKIGFDQIEKAREQQVLRERQEKIRQRKLESKRVDHLARALREEERELLEDWADRIVDQDNDFLDRAEESNAMEQRKAHEEGLKEKEQLIIFQDAKDEWMNAKLEERQEEYERQVEEREERLVQKIAEQRIRKAKERREQQKAQREKEREEEERKEAMRKKKQKEEEERLERERREEEERIEKERKKAEEAEKRKEEEERRERAEAKRRAKEKELEEREKEREAEARREREERDQERRQAKQEENSWRRGDRDGPSRGDRFGDRGDRDRDDRGGPSRFGDRDRDDRGGPSRFGDRDRDDRGGTSRFGDRDRNNDRGDRGGFGDRDRNNDRGDRDRYDNRGGNRAWGRDDDNGGGWRRGSAREEEEDEGPRNNNAWRSQRSGVGGDRDRDRRDNDDNGGWRRGPDNRRQDRDEEDERPRREPLSRTTSNRGPGGNRDDDDGGAWGRKRDDGPVRRGGDDGPVRRGGDDGPVRRGGDDGPVRRGGDDGPVRRGGDDGPVRRGGDDGPVRRSSNRDDEEGGAWRKGPPGGMRSSDRDRDEGPARRPAPRDEPERAPPAKKEPVPEKAPAKAAPEPEPEDGFETVVNKKKKSKEKEAAPAEDDEGWSQVTTGRRVARAGAGDRDDEAPPQRGGGGGGAWGRGPPGGDRGGDRGTPQAGGLRRTNTQGSEPPWRKNKDDSKEDGGKAGGDRSGVREGAPWRNRGGGADGGGSWR